MPSDPQKSSLASCLFMLLFPAFLGGGLYLFFALRSENKTFQSQVEQELFTPYLAAVKEGKFPDAYKTFTDENYQKLNPLDTYQKHYADVTQKYGAITKTEVYSIQEKDMFGEKKRSQAIVRIYFADQTLFTISYLIIKGPNGKYLINQTDRKTLTTYIPESW